jgi:hypothetical protein
MLGLFAGFALLLVFFAIPQSCLAQGGVGELTGVITDPSGGRMPKVAATLTNNATGQVHNTIASDSGFYRFADLPVVGTYSLKVSASNFKTFEAGDIVVEVGRTVTLDVHLELGTASQVVQVEVGVQLMQTTESQVGDVLDQKDWQSLPLETRSQNSFIYTLAGANPDAGTGRGAAVDGARSGTGNFLVDGYDNNEQGQGGRGSLAGGAGINGAGGANTSISPDAIEEYRVIEHLPPAEYGKTGGFVTDTVLKSGTDKFHGSLFEYNRIQALAANSWFSNASGETDHLVRNQFGGSVGGPIIKGKTFFFFTTEAHRERESTPLTFTSTTQQFLNFVNSGAFETFMESNPNGLCVTFTGAACPGAFNHSATLGPIFNQLYKAEPFPLATSNFSQCGGGLYTGGGDGYALTPQCTGGGITYPVPVFGQATVAQPTALNQIRYSSKVDQKLSDTQQLSGSFLYENADSSTAFAGGDGSYGVNEPVHGRGMNAGITWTWTLSPTVTNQARISYVRHTFNFPGDAAASALGAPSIVTEFDPLAISFGNSSGLPQLFTENAFIYRDDLSFTRGKHSFKTGFSYERTRNGSSFEADNDGQFLPYGIEDLVTDMTFSDQADAVVFGHPAYGSWYEATAAVDPATGARPDYYRGYRANDYAAYFQDDWRITKTLTLNLGLRYDYFGVPHNFQPGLDSNFYFGSTTTPFTTTSDNPFIPADVPFYAGIANGSIIQKNSNLWNKDTNNFAPRAGFAWDTFGNSKFVVRGGYGIGYDQMYNNIYENIRFNPPAYCACSFGALINNVPGGALETPGIYGVPFTATSDFVNPAILPVLPDPTPRNIDENLVTPYYEQVNFGFQYEISKDFSLETDYIGTFGKKLLGLVEADTFDGRDACDAPPGPTAANPAGGYPAGTPCANAGFPDGFSNARPNTSLAGDTLRANDFSSIYHGLQVILRKRFTNGLQFNANYTFSKALDQLSDVFFGKLGSFPSDSQNVWNDYGPADFDVKHRFVTSFNYDLPFFKANRWLGGWSASGIITLQSGTPFSVIDTCGSCDTNEDGIFEDRASYSGQTLIGHGSPANGYLVQSAFSQTICPPTVNAGLWCEGGSARNAFVGPGYKNVDFGVAKSFAVTEHAKLTFAANFFNLLNHPSFSNPDADVNDGANFGLSFSTVSQARITQLALRLDF